MLGRRSGSTGTAEAGPVEEAPQPAGKGRPTPKRSDSRKARRTVTPRNSKEAAALRRERSREDRQRARQALISGDERYLPARDAGPERRLARDVVDSRFSYGQVFFGLIIVVFLLSMVNNTVIREVANLVALLSLVVMALDGARHGRKARDAVAAKYGADRSRGIATYAFMRALLPRRFRRPPAKVTRGARVA